MAKEEKSKERRNKLIPIAGRYEMNLAQLPIAVPSRRTKRTSLKCTFKPIQLDDGSKVEPQWVVSADAQEGLPTEFGERTLVALVTLVRQQGFRGDRRTRGSYYQLLQIMRLPPAGCHYQQLKKELRRLKGVTIWGDFVFWDAKREKLLRLERGFNIFDDLKLTAEKEEDEERGIGFEVQWDEVFWDNFVSGYLMEVDRELYFERLQRPLARRLYLVIKQAWYGKSDYTFDVLDLGQILGMEEYKYPSRAKRTLERALKELQECWDDLAAYEFWRNKRGFWKLTVYKATKELAAITAETREAKVWRQVLQELEGQMTKATFEAWLKNTELLQMDGRAMVIGVRNEYQKDWLENRLLGTIKETVTNFLGEEDIHIEFQIQ